MTLFTLVTAIIIAFIHGWQLTLLILACIPLVAATNAIRVKSMTGHASKDQKALEEAGRVSSPQLKCMNLISGRWLCSSSLFVQELLDWLGLTETVNVKS